MSISIHRREQWDLNYPEAVKPWLACHVRRGSVSKRLFVLWDKGFRGFGVYFKWGRY